MSHLLSPSMHDIKYGSLNTITRALNVTPDVFLKLFNSHNSLCNIMCIDIGSYGRGLRNVPNFVTLSFNNISLEFSLSP